MSEVQFLMPIHRAIKKDDLPEVVRLVGGIRERLEIWTPFGTWLHDAASYGSLEVVRWLVSQGLDLDAFSESTEIRPIEKAASNGHVEVVRFLIESGASLDVSSSIRNPLFAAITGGLTPAHTAVAKTLLEAGIDATIRYPNLHNMNAFEYAREWGRTEIASLLETASSGEGKR